MMNEKTFLNLLIIIIIFMIDSSPAQRPERISYKGKSYQVTQIIEINGQNATLRTTDNKSITVPIRFLTTRLKGQWKNYKNK